MAKYAYRCMKCRTRNTFRKKVDNYVLQRKCKCCGSPSFYWDKERNTRNAMGRYHLSACSCSLGRGYYGYTHRKGSKICEYNPNWELNLRSDSKYATETRFEVLAEMLFEDRLPVQSTALTVRAKGLSFPRGRGWSFARLSMQSRTPLYSSKNQRRWSVSTAPRHPVCIV